MGTVVARVRLVAAAGAGVVAVIYLLIGFSAVAVVDDQTGLVPPMLLAGAVFGLLAALLALSAARVVAAAGAALQLLVVVGYVAIASERTSAYEAWGIATKALQVLLLIALVYVTLRHPGRPAARRTDDRTLSRA